MKKCNSCPFENTQCGQFCSLLAEHNRNDTDHLCEYLFECTQLRDSLVQENKIAVIL
jgi:hypothetical protein